MLEISRQAVLECRLAQNIKQATLPKQPTKCLSNLKDKVAHCHLLLDLTHNGRLATEIGAIEDNVVDGMCLRYKVAGQRHLVRDAV